MLALSRLHISVFCLSRLRFATQPDPSRLTVQTGWSCWRRRVDESLVASIFPPARFRQFRICPRYWCYLDYVLSEQELEMCARLPAILVGGGASVLIADA